MRKRTFLFAGLALSFFLALTHQLASAQTRAEKQLASERFMLVSPFPPGGPVDALARILAEGLQKRYSQSAVVENLPGAADSGLHLAGELLKQQVDIHLLHVSYKGTGPALNGVLGGVVPLMFSNLPATLPHLKSGKLVALGLTDSARSAAASEIPTLAEQGITGGNVISWYGLLTPAGTPADVVEQLARDAADILSQPAVTEQLTAQGLTNATQTPAEFAAHIKTETSTWARIIKARGITAE